MYWWRTAGSRNPMLRLTIWSHPPQVQWIYSIRVLTLGSNLPGKMSAGPEGMHFFIKWSKTNQMGRCVQRTKGRHMCPVPAMEVYRECCHCSTHSSPLFHFKDGRTLTSKSFRSTFLPLVWWSYVATIQPNITPTLVQPCTVAARTGLPHWHHLEPRKRWSKAYQTYVLVQPQYM